MDVLVKRFMSQGGFEDNITGALSALDDDASMSELLQSHPKTMVLHGPKIELYQTKMKESGK